MGKILRYEVHKKLYQIINLIQFVEHRTLKKANSWSTEWKEHRTKKPAYKPVTRIAANLQNKNRLNSQLASQRTVKPSRSQGCEPTES